MNSSNKMVTALFADAGGMATPKSGGRPQTLGEKFVGQMQVGSIATHIYTLSRMPTAAVS